jgi:hypothetical protein
MTREYMISECLKKLPYPKHFYDKLNDGSLWNIYNKHVVNGIPINKKKQQNNIENQITIEEYMEMKKKEKPYVIQDSNGIFYRLADNGRYYEIYDSEEYDAVKKIFEYDALVQHEHELIDPEDMLPEDDYFELVEDLGSNVFDINNKPIKKLKR